MAETQQQDQNIDTAWAYGFPSVRISAELGRKIDAAAVRKRKKRYDVIGEAFARADVASINEGDHEALEETYRVALEQYLQKEIA